MTAAGRARPEAPLMYSLSVVITGLMPPVFSSIGGAPPAAETLGRGSAVAASTEPAVSSSRRRVIVMGGPFRRQAVSFGVERVYGGRRGRIAPALIFVKRKVVPAS